MIVAPAMLWPAHPAPPIPRAATPLTLTFARSTLIGGTTTAGTVTLSTPAPNGGANVTITNPSGTTVQAGAAQAGGIQSVGSTKIKVDGGQQTVTFQVLTAGVATSTAATFTACSGNDQSSATLTINPASLASLSVAPTPVLGGASATGTITLDGPAPAGTGATIQLSAAAPTFVSDGSVRTVNVTSPFVPATALVPPGATSVTFPVTTAPVSADLSLQINAVLRESQRSATILVKAPVVTSLLLNPSSVFAGNSVTGTVILNGVAPARGLTTPLSASNSNATVPPSITVPAGSDRQTFQIATPFLTSFTATGGVNTVTIRTGLATSNNLAQITDGTSNTILVPQTPATSAVLTLFPQRSLASVAASPSPVTGGSPITVTLTIPREAASRDPTPPPTGTEGTVELKPDNPSLVRLPTSVAIPAGALTVLVNGTTTIPTADQTVVISAVHVSTVTTSLTVKKPIPVLALFSLRPTTVTGGQNFIASLQLSSAITSPQVVRLSIDHTGLVVLPDSVTIPVSSVPTSFTFKTNPVTVQTTATVTAIAGTQRIPVALTIVP